MKKIILLSAISLLLAVLLCSCVFAGDGSALAVLIPNENGEEIRITPVSDIYYLPSSVDITKVGFNFEGEITCAGGATVASGGTLDLSAFETVDERGEKCYRVTLTADGKTKDYTFYHDGTLSSVFVTTSIGLSAIDRDKEARDKEAQIVILNGDGSAEYSDLTDGTASEIKSRGNATWTYLKKAYQIKLDAKTDLFGMGKAKTWILLANYTDQSMLHNALGFTLGDALELDYNIDYRFVNLYVDGEYRGMYMLCEKVQIGDNRVEIADLEKETEKQIQTSSLTAWISASSRAAP